MLEGGTYRDFLLRDDYSAVLASDPDGGNIRSCDGLKSILCSTTSASISPSIFPSSTHLQTIHPTIQEMVYVPTWYNLPVSEKMVICLSKPALPVARTHQPLPLQAPPSCHRQLGHRRT